MSTAIYILLLMVWWIILVFGEYRVIRFYPRRRVIVLFLLSALGVLSGILFVQSLGTITARGPIYELRATLATLVAVNLLSPLFLILLDHWGYISGSNTG